MDRLTGETTSIETKITSVKAKTTTRGLDTKV